ncbi:hypothetical protein XBFFL1_1160034 [Xenorhabdus bovienii str. feltiae Florida]|nr:hypothetical protein XBFFR1_1760002 [Xenorhabdus bovienii str. feltiae France]CDG90897.1 hypothetical protein XBFFL1_1160034 [Xenorhabdus bovienii str. feltiae Florida]
MVINFHHLMKTVKSGIRMSLSWDVSGFTLYQVACAIEITAWPNLGRGHLKLVSNDPFSFWPRPN